MKYKKIITGKFIDRPNRFIAHVEIEGKKETVHVKNTGRCRELLLPGVSVILEDWRGPEGEHRKTKFDLVAVYKSGIKHTLLINMDSQAPNKVMHEWLKTQSYSFIKPEYTYGNSRIDFYLEEKNEKWLVEVKGCTLEINGTGFFPDAPTERGVKHLEELAAAVNAGFNCAVAFVIQMDGIKEVRPNIETHPEFGVAMEKARAAGVEVWFMLTHVTEDGLEITERIKG